MTDYDIEYIAFQAFEARAYPDDLRKTKRLYGDKNHHIEVTDDDATLAMIRLTMLRGAEAGIKPLAALYNIVWYNGKPCIYGDVARGLVFASGQVEVFNEEADDDKASCTIQRKGYGSITRSFTMDDARRANLHRLEHWRHYPARMLAARARSFAIRDSFSDLLAGLSLAEEMKDVEEMRKAPAVPAAPAATEVDEYAAKELAARQPLEVDWNVLDKNKPLAEVMQDKEKPEINQPVMAEPGTKDVDGCLVSTNLEDAVIKVEKAKAQIVPQPMEPSDVIAPLINSLEEREPPVEDAPEPIVSPEAIEATLQDAEKRHKGRIRKKICKSCNDTGVVPDPENPEETIMCKVC